MKFKSVQNIWLVVNYTYFGEFVNEKAFLSIEDAEKWLKVQPDQEFLEINELEVLAPDV